MKEDYQEKTKESAALFRRAKKVFAGGVNHNTRFYEPYPIFLSKAKGQHVWDEDGHRYTDFWMGHLALILGHSPRVVTDALRSQLPDGTHFGMGSSLAVDLGEEVQQSVPCAEMMRFCNTGAEATMYLVRLARAYSRRRIIIKMAGGWHGYNTELNKGVHRPFDRTEGEGILREEQTHVRTVTFNDLEAAERLVEEEAGDVAAIFLEPVLGAGGCIPADREYLRGLRELADRWGIILAFDEIITGFRVAIGGAQEFYQVKPDLAAFGKVVGGGLPIGLVCGREEILALADPSNKKGFVSIGGGTFSENPLTMSAGLATVRFLRRNATALYPRLDRMGKDVRKGIDEALAEAGVEASTTGLGSMFFTHFGGTPRNAEGAATDNKQLARDYAVHLMSEGTFLLPGHPAAVSSAHTTRDVDALIANSRKFGESPRNR